MTDSTTIALAAISTVGGIVSAWMAGRSRTHASTAVGAAKYVAASLRPPPADPDGVAGKVEGRCNTLYENHGETEVRLRRCLLRPAHPGVHFDGVVPDLDPRSTTTSRPPPPKGNT